MNIKASDLKTPLLIIAGILLFGMILGVYSLLAPTHISRNTHQGLIRVVDDVEVRLHDLNARDLVDVEAYRVSPTGTEVSMRLRSRDSEFVYYRNPGYYQTLKLLLPPQVFDKMNGLTVEIGNSTFPISAQEIEQYFTRTTTDNDRIELTLRQDALGTGPTLLPPFRGLINYRGDGRVFFPALIAAAIIVLSGYTSIKYRSALRTRIAPFTAVGIAVLAAVVRIYLPHVAPGPIPFWIIDTFVFVLMLVAAVRLTFSDNSEVTSVARPEQVFGREDIKFVLALVTLVFVTQIPFLGETPMSNDGFYSYFAAHQIAEIGEPVYEQSGYRYGRAPLYHNLLANSLELFGFNEFGGRIINVFASVAIVLILYFWLRPLSRLAGFLAGTVYVFSPLTIETVRIIRMYPLFSMFFLLTIVAYYHALVLPAQSNPLRSWSFSVFKVDLRWLLPLFVFGYLAYATHPFIVQFVFGLVAFYLVSVTIRPSNLANWIFLLLFIGLIFAGAWYRYETLNLYEAYYVFPTGDWAMDKARDLLEYPDRVFRIAPYVPFAVLLLVLFGRHAGSGLTVYATAIFMGGILFMMPQRQVSSRYIFALTTLLPVIAVLASRAARTIASRKLWLRIILVCLVTTFGYTQLWLFAKEHSDLDRQDWNAAIEYLDNMEPESYTLIASRGAAQQLWGQGLEADFFVFIDDLDASRNGESNTHYRFGIPLLRSEDQLLSQIADEHTERTVVVFNVPPPMLDLQQISQFRLPQIRKPLIYSIPSDSDVLEER